MAKKITITNRKAQNGHKRSHAMNASNRKFNLNMQKVTLTDSNGKKVTIVATTKDIRTIKNEIKKAKASK